MTALTRSPRLLVKLPAAPSQASFRFDNKSLNIGFERLFSGIQPLGEGSGAVSGAAWYVMSAAEAAAEVNGCDLCHHLVAEGFGVAGPASPEAAEPDLEQQWVIGTPVEHALAAARTCDRPTQPDTRLPTGPGCFWFRDRGHSQLEAARPAIGRPTDRVRIAHFDTGYDPDHQTRTLFLLAREPTNLQRNFVDDGRLDDDATDHTAGVFTNSRHRTGTLGILAGTAVDGAELGGAPFLEVIPLRGANSVVLFRNSAIAKAFDYVHGLFKAKRGTRELRYDQMQREWLHSSSGTPK